MKWTKAGLIFEPDRARWWQVSHAALPTRLDLGGGRFRVFYCSRDRDNRAHVGRFDLLLPEQRIVDPSVAPVLEPGAWGCFDDHGVQPCSIARADNGDLYLYYLGWNPSLRTPLFYTAIGLAVSRDGGETFQRHSPAPILQRSPVDPWMVSGGTVRRVGKGWIMYYLSGMEFRFGPDGAESRYDLKIARSDDGVSWRRSGEVAIGLRDDETNISRITIDDLDGVLRGWFPVKRPGLGYRCGYAVSVDGERWERQAGPVLEVSETGWDSEAVDKMEVIRFGARLYMLYNGNQFGRDGIGLAYAEV
jgi:hypothetical protein